MKRLLASVIALCLLSSQASAVETNTQVYWGDTHLHTSLSFDSYTFGSKGTPDLAYRYAKGYPIIHPVLSTLTQIDTPLDFLIVADHAETLGTVARLLEGNAPELENTPTGKYVIQLAGKRSQKELDSVYNSLNLIGSGSDNGSGLTAADIGRDLHGKNIRTSWIDTIETADKHNKPGEFTAFIGWEWTSQPGGANFHRVIFTPDNSKKAKHYLPFSTLESDDPEALWKWLDLQEQEAHTEFLAIPHGSNISNGLMFGFKRRNGQPIDSQYAQKKLKYETAIEITQIKGDSETHPLFSPDDQFADFETYNFLSSPEGLTPDATTGDYVRSGFRNGLQLEKEIGLNPYKMGIAGGTDSHVGISAIEESSFGGKSGHDVLPAKRSGPSGIGAARGWDMGAAGFTAVWAENNTRRDLFESFRRKEIYASTGPRITLRFFGGFKFSKSDIKTQDFVVKGYEKGVPMGGDLYSSENTNNEAPSFLIAALKDPKAANLDRIQVVKGWLNSDGSTDEKVYDVALSGNRTDGNKPVGNTVNLKTGSYTNSIGDPELRTYWEDPDFNAKQPAFYYVRVLEIPTPRYSLLDAIALGIDPKETGKPSIIQERVYSSPIWYTPKH